MRPPRRRRPRDRRLLAELLGGARQRAGLVDPLRAREVEDPQVEGLEAGAVVEVPQVRELVAQRVHEARVLERAAGRRVAQADPDAAVGVADAVAAADVGALRLDGAEAQAETLGDP